MFYEAVYLSSKCWEKMITSQAYDLFVIVKMQRRMFLPITHATNNVPAYLIHMQRKFIVVLCEKSGKLV